MEKIAEFIKNNKANIIIAVLYLLTVTITMLHHELWRDEAQAWCIARDCGFLELFERSRIDGHPLFWYLLLMPFAKAGISVMSMQIIGMLFCAVGVLYMLFKFPFNTYTKFVTAFSAGLLYALPVIVRNYALIPVFVFLLAELYPKRHEKPWLYSFLIIMLANTHLLIECLAFGLFVFFAIENIQIAVKEKKYKCLYPLIPLIINFLVLFLWFKGVDRENIALIKYFERFHVYNSFLSAICSFSYTFYLFPFDIFGKLNHFILYSMISLFTASLYFKDKKIFAIMLSSFVYFFFVYYYVWFNGIKYQKAFILLLIMIFCFRVCYEKRDKFLTGAFCFLFTINALFSIFNVMYEINNNFSASKQTAEYIKNNLKDEKIFYIQKNAFLFSSISAYLPGVKLYHPKLKSYVTYYDFKAEEKNEKKPETKYLIAQNDPDIVINPKIYTLIFASDYNVLSGTGHEEVYKIYKRKD